MYKHKINSINFDKIHEYLKVIDSDFSPKLSYKIPLHDYAKKIAENATIFETWEKNTLVATVIAYINNENTKQAFVTCVHCKMEYRGKGLISDLFKLLEGKCKEKSFRTIALECDRDNINAYSLYLKLNFMVEKNNNNKVYMVKYLQGSI